MIIQPVVSERVLASTGVSDVACSTAIEGTVVKVVATLTETAVTSGYYFNVQFPVGAGANAYATRLGSGLSTGDAYPVELTKPTAGADVVIVSESATADSIKVTSGTVAAAALVADFMITVPDDG